MTTRDITAEDSRNEKKFYFGMTPFRRVLTAIVVLVFKVLTRLEVSGQAYIPMEGAAVVAANHVNNLDVFPWQLALPRPLFFMAKAELFRNPLLDVVIRNLGAFPVRRGAKDQWALQHARQVLAHGQLLGMFPEGSRSRGKGLRVAKTGAARLAQEMGVPLIPVAISGTDQILKKFPHRAVVRVKILPPMYPRTGESPMVMTDRLMFTIAENLPESMRGVYAERLPEFSRAGKKS